MSKYKLVTATWCGPCKTLKSQLAEDRIEVDIIDADENVEYLREHGIRSVPSLIVEGEVKEIVTSGIFEYLKANA